VARRPRGKKKRGEDHTKRSFVHYIHKNLPNVNTYIKNDMFDRTVTLLKKAYFETLSPGERLELERLLEDEHLREVHGELIRGELLREGILMDERFPYREAFAAFKRRVGWQQRRRRIIAIVTAAAAVVALALLSPVAYRSLAPGERQAVAEEEAVITPGRARASVRLASGTVVEFSDRPRRIEEGATRVTYEDGKIVYRSGEQGGEAAAPAMNELLVPRGGECYIVFDDGTRAWVNADSRVTYPVKFTGTTRSIRVEGEVYLEVEPSDKPFVVQTRLGEVTALGTSFAVRSYGEEEEMTATLVSGKIVYTGFNTEELAPGERVTVSPSGNVTKEKVDVREHVGWKEGLFVFNKRSLESIMIDLARWYECTVEYLDPALKQVPFSGHLKRYDNINAFLELLRETGEMDYVIRDRHVILFK
jgi:ferric-dicitrate binding protein FerR (iron transport regulator)